jgi:hypothetical protein
MAQQIGKCETLFSLRVEQGVHFEESGAKGDLWGPAPAAPSVP